MARKKAPSNQGAVWTTKDFAAIGRLVKTGATGKTVAKKIGILNEYSGGRWYPSWAKAELRACKILAQSNYVRVRPSWTA
jgi:hypothetical protein